MLIKNAITFLSIIIFSTLLSLTYQIYKITKKNNKQLRIQYATILNVLNSQLSDPSNNSLAQINSIKNFLDYKELPLEKLNKLDFLDEQQLDKGLTEMKKHKVVFTGISRDNASELPMVIRHIEAIGTLFNDYQVIVFENDSKDATKIILNLWKLINPRVNIISKDYMNKKRPSIKFLADIRNQYLEELQKPRYQDFDIVIPMDMDMKYGIDLRGVQDSFSKINQWDALCANGIYNKAGNMYDAFAFRNDEFPESPGEYANKTGKSYWTKQHLDAIQKIYLPSENLVPVYSCFNGLAMYKKSLFSNCLYDSIEEDCEHIILHQCMKEKHNARIFMNPALIIRYEHYQN